MEAEGLAFSSSSLSSSSDTATVPWADGEGEAGREGLGYDSGSTVTPAYGCVGGKGRWTGRGGLRERRQMPGWKARRLGYAYGSTVTPAYGCGRQSWAGGTEGRGMW